MPIDVFLRLAPKSPLRSYLARAVFERWQQEPDIRLHPIWMTGCDWDCQFGGYCEVVLGETDFCWTTRNYAEERAQCDFYILSDDDHLPVGEGWAQRMLESMQMQYQAGFGLRSARSLIHFERMEHSDFTGCPCIIRKGVVDFRKLEGPPDRQDEITCRAMHAAGFKTGFIHGLDYNHLGSGFSQVNPILWNGL